MSRSVSGLSARIAVLLLGVGISVGACSQTSPSARATALATAPQLGAAQSFAVLGSQAVTNTGPTTVSGNLGIYPNDAVTGFPPGEISGGTIHAADAVAMQARDDSSTAYTAAAGQPCGFNLTGQDLGGQTLVPGVYCFDSSAQLTGALVLDTKGDPNAVFVFLIGSTLTTATDSSVAMLGGAGCNVAWQVGSSATLGVRTHFIGTILALTSITLTTGATLAGRALAHDGAVTLDSNSVSATACTNVPLVDAGVDAATDGAVAMDMGTAPDGSVAPVDMAHAQDGSVAPVDMAQAPAPDGSVAPVDMSYTPDSGPTCSACVDFQTDHDNCGSCGNVCDERATCVDGSCTIVCG